MLLSMGLQRVGHDWATELNWTEKLIGVCLIMSKNARKRTITMVWNNLNWEKIFKIPGYQRENMNKWEEGKSEPKSPCWTNELYLNLHSLWKDSGWRNVTQQLCRLSTPYMIWGGINCIVMLPWTWNTWQRF